MARKLKKVSANSDLVIPTLNRIIPSIEVQKRIVCVRGMTAIIDADIADSRTKRISETLFLIHEFMHENECGLDFFSSFIGEIDNNI